MNSPIILEMEQGSPEWLKARCGLVTASRCGDAAGRTKKGEETAAHRNYRHEIMCEILTGQPYPQYVSAEMQWGSEQEPFPRAAYELQYNLLVETVGFALHPDIPRFGASPDGLVGDDGLIQIKCPNTSTHLGWLMSGKVPIEHCTQMMAEMACTGREWCDFVSYDPRLPEHLQLVVRRLPRDEKVIAALEELVIQFNSEVDDLLRSLPEPPQGAVLLMDMPMADEITF